MAGIAAILTLVLFSSVGLARPITLDAQLDYCKGNPAEAKRKLDAILANDPQNANAYFLRGFELPEDVEDSVDKAIEELKSGIQPRKEIERLVYADALLTVHSADLNRVEKLLDFKGSRSEIEVKRLDLLAGLRDVQERGDDAFELIGQALDLQGNDRPTLLASLILVSDTQQRRNEATKYLTKMKLFEHDDPYLEYTETIWARTQKSLKPSEILSKIQKIVHDCPSERLFAESLSVQYFNMNMFQESYDLLKDLRARWKYHRPEADWAFALAAAHIGRYAEATDALLLAQRAENFVSPFWGHRSEVKNGASTIAKIRTTNLILKLIPYFFAVIYILFILWIWKKRKKILERKT
jgi:hypothetical protein